MVASRRDRRKRKLMAGVLVAVLLVAAIAVWARSRPSSAPAGSVGVIRSDRAAAKETAIIGATTREREAARASLALVGSDARRLTMRFSRCPGDVICHPISKHRSLVVQSRAGLGRTRQSDLIKLDFVKSLVASDTADRLLSYGERVAWRLQPDETPGTGRHRPRVDRMQLEQAGRAIADRARHAGLRLAPIRLYPTLEGGMLVVVRLDDEALLAGRNTTVYSTLFGPGKPPPIRNTLLLLQGPGGVPVGGGGSQLGWRYGGSLNGFVPPTVHAPTWLTHGHTDLRISITPGNMTLKSGRTPRAQKFRLRCGQGTSGTPTSKCTRLWLDRAVLFSPIQTDTQCGGSPFGTTTISGVVGGIQLARSYDGCYSGVTLAWETLLGAKRMG